MYAHTYKHIYMLKVFRKITGTYYEARYSFNF